MCVSRYLWQCISEANSSGCYVTWSFISNLKLKSHLSQRQILFISQYQYWRFEFMSLSVQNALWNVFESESWGGGCYCEKKCVLLTSHIGNINGTVIIICPNTLDPFTLSQFMPPISREKSRNEFFTFPPKSLTISLTFLLKIALLKSHCSHFTQIFSLAQNVLLVHLMSEKVREEPRTAANQQTWESRWALTRSSSGQTNNKKTCVS